jgi:hypothetical protein
VEVAASVAARLARDGHAYEVATTDGTSLGPTLTRSPESAVGGLALVMDRLAVVEPKGDESLTSGTGLARASRSSGLVVAVTGTLAGAELEALAGGASVRRPVVVVATRGGVTPRATPGLTVIDLAQASFPRAWDEAMVARRRTAARHRAGGRR